MSDLASITGRLDITPTTIDTTYAKSRGRARHIKKVPYTFTAPAITFTPNDLGYTIPGVLIAQFVFQDQQELLHHLMH